MQQPNGLVNVPASLFVRPYSPYLRTHKGSAKPPQLSSLPPQLEPLRLRRISESIKRAAVSKEVLHLWWHPHDFGINIDQNVGFLRGILEEFCRCRESYDMRSMGMADVAAVVKENYER